MDNNIQKMAMQELARRELARRESLKGGAMSPANVQAQQDLTKAQEGVSPVAQAGMAVKSVAEPAGVMANSAMFGIPGITSELLSGGKLVNPMTNGLRVTQGGTNVFEGGDMTGGQKMAAGIGGALLPTGALLNATGITKGIGNAIKYTNPANESALAKTVRTAAYKAKTDAVNEFGQGLDELAKANPDKTVSLRNVVDNINTNMAEMAPEAKSILRRTPVLKDLLDNPQLAENIPLEDTQKIINYINTKVPRNIKANHLDILDTLNDTRAAQLDAFPEMADVRSKYGEFKNAFDTIKGKLKQGSLIDNMAKDFGDSEIKDNLKKVFTEDMLKEVKNFQEARKMLKVAGVMSKTIGYGALAGAGIGEGADIAKKLIP